MNYIPKTGKSVKISKNELPLTSLNLYFRDNFQCYFLQFLINVGHRRRSIFFCSDQKYFLYNNPGLVHLNLF